MRTCYLGDSDITTCNTEEQQQKYRLGTIRNRLPWIRSVIDYREEWGGGKHVLLDPNSCPSILQCSKRLFRMKIS